MEGNPGVSLGRSHPPTDPSLRINPKPYMSQTLNSFKGVIWGIMWRTIIGVIKGDTRSLDYSSHGSDFRKNFVNG